MNLLVLEHYPLVASASMRAYADLIRHGLQRRGHRVDTLTAHPHLGRLVRPGTPAAKWLGYLDQFLLFPPRLWLRLRRLPPGSLVVVCDQALGPWVPLLRHQRHVVHCHDLLALDSSLGHWPANPVGLTGWAYQHLIRWGFRHGRAFLSISTATQAALLPHLPAGRQLAVLPNPLDPAFQPAPHPRPPAARPYLLHVGSTWYKNRPALLRLFSALLQNHSWPDLQLVLVGAPEPAMVPLLAAPVLQGRVKLLEAISRERLINLYHRAEALIFPSLAEGFGWPPLEALACGCPAVISPVDPLLSLTGGAATVLPPFSHPHWPQAAAAVVDALLRRSPAEREQLRQKGLAQAARFPLEAWLDALEAHYSAVCRNGRLAPSPPYFPLPVPVKATGPQSGQS
jgi:glycosyltransferase involved in cell wall biosynthesis